jgi:hypothetical protein
MFNLLVAGSGDRSRGTFRFVVRFVRRIRRSRRETVIAKAPHRPIMFELFRAPLHERQGEALNRCASIVSGRSQKWGALFVAPHADGNLEFGGTTTLVTTTQDLAKWDESFYQPKVGGQSFIDAMRVRGKLTDGKQVEYECLGSGTRCKNIDAWWGAPLGRKRQSPPTDPRAAGAQRPFSAAMTGANVSMAGSKTVK